ncbi:MAG: hypothetical protein V4723_17940 [Pseudomonadota bacterium]
MKTMEFKIFGTLIGVTGAKGQWNAFYLGNEGKRRAADFIVPNDLGEEEICDYLADLFHEHATQTNSEACRIR